MCPRFILCRQWKKVRHSGTACGIEWTEVFAMFITFKKWTALYVLVLLLLFGGFAAILWRGSAINTSKNLALAQGMGVLVIDPGHGGFDGGAVADDGTVEAQINLAVALQMEEIARLVGVDTVLTRREDTALDDPTAGTVRQRKVSDLKNRVELVNQVQGGILVSIHQNSLPEVKSVHGAQAFYNSSGEALAQAVQEALNQAVNDRPKESRAAGSGIYLLDHVQTPAVLVECGFLSNREETVLLKSQAHQIRLALTIFAAAREYFLPVS